jgi:hypothetical protein
VVQLDHRTTPKKGAPLATPETNPTPETEPKIYEISWTFGGSVNIEANSDEEARAAFYELDHTDLLRQAYAEDIEGLDLVDVFEIED